MDPAPRGSVAQILLQPLYGGAWPDHQDLLAGSGDDAQAVVQASGAERKGDLLHIVARHADQGMHPVPDADPFQQRIVGHVPPQRQI